jgi:hypothetical protein
LKTIILTALIASIISCSIKPKVNSFEQTLLAANQSQVQVRSYQTRTFESNDKLSVMRAVVATLQDLNFVIMRTDSNLGIITGEKNHENSSIFITVSTKEKNNIGTVVRVSIIRNKETIEYLAPYQDFFSALQKSVFLQINNIN